jgi:ribosomal protein L5
MLSSSSRLRYHYENVLRQDLLLKLNYANIMQVPRLCEIKICSSCRSFDYVKNVSLALEVLCGQKFVERSSSVENTHHRFARFPRRSTRQVKNFQSLRAKTASFRSERGSTASLLRGAQLGPLGAQLTSLHAPQFMYNFLEKFITALAFYDYTINFQANTIQITVGTQVRLFPEIQNHFEFFELLTDLQVFIVTSALSENETQLLWTGLLQKEN